MIGDDIKEDEGQDAEATESDGAEAVAFAAHIRTAVAEEEEKQGKGEDAEDVDALGEGGEGMVVEGSDGDPAEDHGERIAEVEGARDGFFEVGKKECKEAETRDGEAEGGEHQGVDADLGEGIGEAEEKGGKETKTQVDIEVGEVRLEAVSSASKKDRDRDSTCDEGGEKRGLCKHRWPMGWFFWRRCGGGACALDTEVPTSWPFGLEVRGKPFAKEGSVTGRGFKEGEGFFDLVIGLAGARGRDKEVGGQAMSVELASEGGEVAGDRHL